MHIRLQKKIEAYVLRTVKYSVQFYEMFIVKNVFIINILSTFKLLNVV